ncbi:putative glycosyl hydrolase 18 [Halocaridina rubra]|uniref:Glycosyl hydrolase 18 n=1 Tax=Halocaridina rubra TaxID=373956 RepID=A0AAN9FU41_HALRR
MIQVGYFAIPREGGDDRTRKELSVDAIDPFLCTHIVVGFARIRDNVIVPEAEEDYEIYENIVKLKEQNPNLKILLSLGGGSTDGGFPMLVRDPDAVLVFASSTREFLIRYGFDGLDLDWEFPAWPALRRDRSEKKLFTQLVCQLNQSLKQPPSLFLTLAAAGAKSIIDRSYEIKKLAEYVDFVFLMSYDYHIFWPYLPFTGHNAPLFKRRIEKMYFATMNVQWSACYWVNKGMPKQKLVIGIPTYGRTWRLLISYWDSISSPAIGQGIAKGILSYIEAQSFICEGAKEYFDEESKVPFATRGRHWISFEDSRSVREKTLWIKDQGFAGVMTWNLNCDDWIGVVSGKKFELHHIIKDILFDKLPP